jgi:hypothetical protein
MFIVTRCLDILSMLAQNGECVHAELCKHPALPAALTSFIERVCDEPDAQYAFNTKMLVEDLIKLLCTVVMKACSSGKLKPPGTSDPKYVHAQTLRSMCIRLVTRFKPHPAVSAAHSGRVGVGDVGGGAVAGASAPAAEASLAATPGNAFGNALCLQHSLLVCLTLCQAMTLELLWAVGCVISSDVPFPHADCRNFFNELLQYIETEKNCHIMHAIVSCLSVTLSKLLAPPGTRSSPVQPPASQQHQPERQRAMNSLIRLLLRHPCELGSPGEQQPIDYSGDQSGRRQQHRRLVGQLSSLQQCTLFDMSLLIISNCIDSIEMAASCVSFEKGAILSIVFKKLIDSTHSRDASKYVEMIEKLIDLLCNSQLRHAVAAGDMFPPDLIDPLHDAMKSQRLRQFFEDTEKSHSQARRLHGGMVVPGRGDSPSMTLKQIANREESGGSIPVLAYAAATDLRDAVRLLLRLGADPNGTGGCGKNAMQMNTEHNSGSARMLELLETVKELQVISVKDSSKEDYGLCKRVTDKNAADFVSPILDGLMDAASATPHSEICFSIFLSIFSTITSVHPAILENLFVSLIPTNGDKSPKSTNSTDDTPSAFSESSIPGFKLRASSLADRVFKLMKSVGRKFSRSTGIDHYSFSALKALLVLLKLPTSRPLVRLCHKYRLVDLVELIHISRGSVCRGGPDSFSFHGEEEEEEEEVEEDEEQDGGEPEEHLHLMLQRASEREMRRMMQAHDISSSRSAPACVADPLQLRELQSELSTILATYDVSSSEQSHSNNLVTIAHSLNAAVVGASASSSDLQLISVSDAIKMLCDCTKVL